MSRELDAVARGPLPRDRVRPPARGERCPRCHRPAGYAACLLCCPELVPARFGGRLVDGWEDAAVVAALLPPRVAPSRFVPEVHRIWGESVLLRFHRVLRAYDAAAGVYK